MRFSENFEAAKNMAVEAAQTAAAKAKELAAIAKANISIYAEEDKVKKAEIGYKWILTDSIGKNPNCHGRNELIPLILGSNIL